MQYTLPLEAGYVTFKRVQWHFCHTTIGTSLGDRAFPQGESLDLLEENSHICIVAEIKEDYYYLHR